MQVIYPPREIFQDNGKELSAMANPGQQEVIAHHVEFPEEGGMLLYFENWKYPKKGWPFKEAVDASEHLKRGVIASLKFLMSKPVCYFMPLFYFLPSSWKKKIIVSGMQQFGNFGERCYHKVMMKPNHFCKISREIYRVCNPMVGDDYFLHYFIMALCMTLEFDDAYRYRFQDSLESFDKNHFMKHPDDEIRKMMSVMSSRELGGEGGVKYTAKLIGMFTSMLLQIRVIRNTLLEIVSQLDIDKMKLDDGDWYQCLTWAGYDFGGKPLSERLIMREEIDNDPSQGTWMHDPKILELEKKYGYVKK